MEEGEGGGGGGDVGEEVVLEDLVCVAAATAEDEV